LSGKRWTMSIDTATLNDMIEVLNDGRKF